VQNKFHFAIAGQTAAEIIFSKSDKNRENMGLTTTNLTKHKKFFRILTKK
jgi:hypothetical protein